MNDINLVILSYLDYPTYYKLATDKTRKYWLDCSKCEIREFGGDKYWYVNDKLHREDGPTIEYVNGDKFWYVNDKLHRYNGPAVEYINGYKSWYINGKCIKSE